MPHRSHLCTIVIDVPADRRDGAVSFWSGATGRDVHPLPGEDEFHGARLNDHLVLLVQELGEGLPRVHVDIHTDDVPAEVARLEALGATVIDRRDEWTIMRDPADLPFCVVRAPEATLDTNDVQHWP